MELLAVFLPLFAFLIAGLFGKKIGDRMSQCVTCSALVVAAFASILLFFDVVGGHGYTTVLSPWISSGEFSAFWALRIDQLSVVMICVVNIISACVHIYSIGYMSHDPCKARFMAYLSFFTFVMLMLVTADNLLQLFFGWEGVGLASYLLIGFWNNRDSANSAAIKAFVVNRVGDLGLVLGIMLLFVIFGSIEFDIIFNNAQLHSQTMFTFFGYDLHALTVVCLLLFVGAVGKSAQLGLHTWLPDAMEGPTPVSALIHAATMVTAGVFLVARFSPVFEYAPIALMVVTVFGALTAFMAATIAMTQFDIKRVIAYSTMSQLGYMFFALGVSAYGAAMFHLVTHAFFKSLLFLGAGSVIHAMSDEQDMRKMGGIYKKIPVTYALMLIGSLALAGIFPFAGYFSKDIILEAVWADHTWFGDFAFLIGIIVAFMTAFYSWRLLLMTFHGEPRMSKDVMSRVRESSSVILAPLFILAAGAVFVGFVFYNMFVGHHSIWHETIIVLQENDTITAAHNAPFWIKRLPLLMGGFGIVTAYVFYFWIPSLPAKFSSAFKWIYMLFFNKWFFDEIYNRLIVRGVYCLGNIFWRSGDQNIIDRFGPDGSVKVSRKFAGMLSRFQSGYIYQYAFMMIVAVIGIVSWVIFRVGQGF
ncbi:MAG: NADH-quinone oxidoreductase subunit L [Alphaproteobacteria bacterium]|nr:NADH-quinone oxidoreductase subunit L [Alphaproteobacteria bacterium]